MKTNIIIVGSGCAGLYCALNLPKALHVTIISKKKLEDSDSFLAQGGICMLKNADDYQSFYEDTLKAGHYENDKKSVDVMIRSSPDVIDDLLTIGVSFQKQDKGRLAFTKEGAHSVNRILFYKDITRKEITSSLLNAVKTLKNVTLLEDTCLVDILEEDNHCYGVVVRLPDGTVDTITADTTILATGGIGGLYRNSTNFKHLTGDALAIAINHHIKLKDMNYVQIHPTTFYQPNLTERSFLISESVRGEGAKLYNRKMERFVDELLPRDKVVNAILEQMKLENSEYVWEDLRPIPEKELERHFPNIIAYCKKMGYDPSKECIPVVPAQHYFMGGIKVNHESQTSMKSLYAIGETACNGVHGKNRLASNSLLESLVFAKRAAQDITKNLTNLQTSHEIPHQIDVSLYKDQSTIQANNKTLVLAKINQS